MSRKTLSGPVRKAHPGADVVCVCSREFPRVDHPLRLKCGVCGLHGGYRVGSVLVAEAGMRQGTRADLADYIGFSGYFRCCKCEAGGPWALPSNTLAIISDMAACAWGGEDDAPVMFGSIATFDGRSFRYATECEEHLKELIEREPDRAFLWVRLGNLYRQSEENVLAETAYRKAIELDECDIEAHALLGGILVDTGRSLDAVPHWHAFLKHVRAANDVKDEVREILFTGVMDELLGAEAEAQGPIDSFPPKDGADIVGPPSHEASNIEIHSLDLSTKKGFEELCDMFIDTPDRRRRDWIDRPSTRGRRHHVPVPQGAAAERCIGRNDPCTCGSGRKYKKCCGHSE